MFPFTDFDVADAKVYNADYFWSMIKVERNKKCVL